MARGVAEIFQKHFLNLKIIKKITFSAKQVVNLLCFVSLFSHHHFFNTVITSLLRIYAFYSVSNLEVNAMFAAKRSKSDARQFEEFVDSRCFLVSLSQWYSSTNICAEHSAVKRSLAVPQVLNVILKVNSRNYLEDIQRRIKLSKRQFLVTKNRIAF